MSSNNSKWERIPFKPVKAFSELPWLKIGGVGMGVENMFATTVWDAIQAADGKRIEFPDAPAGSLDACVARGDLFRGEALRATLMHWSKDGVDLQTFVENYPLPSYLIGPMFREGTDLDQWSLRYVERMVLALDRKAGMPFHDLRRPAMVCARVTSAADVWGKLFGAFKQAGDLNSTLVYAEDGYAVRSTHAGRLPPRNESVEEILSRPKMAPDLTECFAGILLMNPASVEWLDDLALFVKDSQDVTVRIDGAKLYGRHGFGGLIHDKVAGKWPPGKYAITDYVKEPWSRAQVQQYHDMPTLGWLYQPQTVSVVDEANAAVPEAECVQRLQQALRHLLDHAFEGTAPVRVFHCLADGTDGALQKNALSLALAQVAPGLDMDDHRVSYDIPTLLGDLGVGMSLVALGLACMAGWEQGGPALIIDWRDKSQAVLLALDPATPESYRKAYRRRPYELVREPGGRR